MKLCKTFGCINLGLKIYYPEPTAAVWLCASCLQAVTNAKST
jgi:hypothetical protein